MKSEPEQVSQPFQPTRVFSIRSHTACSHRVIVLDLTSLVTAPYADSESDAESGYAYEEAIGRAKGHAVRTGATPHLTLTRCGGLWSTRRYDAHMPTTKTSLLPSSPPVAELYYAGFLKPATTITFPVEAGPRSPVIMKKSSFFTRAETFVLDDDGGGGGGEYTWAMDSKWSSNRISLYRRRNAGKAEGVEPICCCAKIVHGHTESSPANLVVDAAMIDPMIALLTGLVVLRKVKLRRQQPIGGGAGS